MKILAIGAAVALAFAMGSPAFASGKKPGKTTTITYQGYSGKPVRSPAGQGTSSVTINKKGKVVSTTGPGNSPSGKIIAKRGLP
jgi:hypothetical protein